MAAVGFGRLAPNMNLFTDSDSRAAPADPAAERRALVALSAVPGVGPARLRALVSAFGSAGRVVEAPPARLAAVEGVGPATARAIASFDVDAVADEQMARAERCGARLVTFADAAYPEALGRIYDPPSLLWVRGELAPHDARAVAVVGTRRATPEGLRAAHTLGRDLAGERVTVVSGLAYGIDIEAHRGALDGDGRTVAVLGSGVDRIYPSRHRREVERILDGRGAVVSELPLGAAPDAGNFPRRNRIVAGMSVATVVVEAYARGGALLTAMMALEQNREVFAFPVAVGAEPQGTNEFIRRGFAALATGADHVLADIEAILPAASDAAPEPAAAAPLPDDLTRDERALLEALDATPTPLDTLCAASGLDTSTALVYLLQLEFRGLVRQLAGKQFYRA